jgi:multiple sugar transport system permease protein
MSARQSRRTIALPTKKNKLTTLGHTFVVVLLAVYALISIFPFLVMASGSIKTNVEVLTNPWPIPKNPTLRTLTDMFSVLDVPSLMLNSLIIAGGSCVLILVIFPLAGFAFATLQFPLKRTIFAIFIGALFVPGVTVLLPVVILDQSLGLSGSPLAVILPIVNGAAPIAIALMRSYYASIPTELYEAAVLDGCSTFGIFRRVYFPLSRSALITITVLNFVAAWNEYVLPSLTNDNPSRFPLPVGLQSLLSQSVVQWNQVMAAALIIVIPIIGLFVFLQRYFINGVQGAVKG